MELRVYLINSDNKASTILDLIRFLSAITVFLMHFYVPVPGYQAVMVFFVLSGYFISSTIYKSINRGSWSWSDYFIKRLTRLWIVLIPCLIFTLFWAEIQFSLFGSTKIEHYLNFKIFIGNLFFLQGIIVPQYGSNGPLWSLSYEFWYYILFPILILVFFSKKTSHRICYGILFILISLFVGHKIMEYFLVWLLGAVIPLLKPIKIHNNFLKIVLLIGSILFALVTMKFYVFFVNKPNLQIIPDLSIGIGFTILFYIIYSFFNHKVDHSRFKISKQLAGFSYTLYLTHYPIAIFIMTWFASPLWPFGKPTLILKMIFACGVLLYAWLISLLTEKQTDKVRRKVSKLFLRNNFKKSGGERINSINV